MNHSRRELTLLFGALLTGWMSITSVHADRIFLKLQSVTKLRTGIEIAMESNLRY
jgi:type IV secretory pathway ATPase VirB11/archaellum biosynthesis ATPase